MWWVGVALAAEPSMSGSWTIAAPADEVDATVSTALDATLDSMNLLVRTFARPYLVPEAYACAAYRTSLVGDTFTVQCDDREPFTWKIGQPGVYTRKNGEPVNVRTQRDGGTVTFDFAVDNGGKKFIYAFGDDGTLVVTQELYSPYMGVPMRWTFPYVRR